MTRLSAVVVLTLFAALVLSCDRPPDTPAAVEAAQPAVVVPTQRPSQPPTPAPPDLRVVATTTEPLFTSAADLDYSPDGSADARGKIVAHSTLIIIGTVAGADLRVERVPGQLFGDLSRPDPNWTTVAYVHDVLVERYLKGSGPGTLPVLLPWGHEEIVPGTGNAPGTLTQVSYSARHLYLEKGGRYLLFLAEVDHAPGLWTGTAEPYRYLLSEGRGRVRTPARNPARPFYTGRSEQDLVDRVKAVIDYQSAVANSGIPHRDRWTLVSLDGNPRLEGTFLTLTVNGDGYGGGDGCNSFGGHTENGMPVGGKDGAFSAPPGAQTLKLCEGIDSLMEQADAYKRAIHDGKRFQINGDRLKIIDGRDRIRLVLVRRPVLPGQVADLSGTQWRLLEEHNESGPTSPATLTFLNEHQLGGTTACRSFIGDYSVRERGRLSFTDFSSLGPSDSCTDEMVELERQFRRHLAASDDHSVDGSTGEEILRIRTHRDEVLSFEPMPTTGEDIVFSERWSLEGFTKPDHVNSWYTIYSRMTDLIPGTEIIISFEEGALSGSGDCHLYEAVLDIEGLAIKVEKLLVTEKPCDDRESIMEQETRFTEILKRAELLRIYGDQLFLEADNDEALLFRAE